MVLPVTIATNERGFSKLKIIKNRLRTRINDDRLQALLLCSIETDLMDELTDEEQGRTTNIDCFLSSVVFALFSFCTKIVVVKTE